MTASLRGVRSSPVDEALAGLGLSREVVIVVPGFAAALAVAVASDLVALLPWSFVLARAAASLAPPFAVFLPPLSLAGITVSQMWHPRLDADAAHRWLCGLVLEAAATLAEADES